MIGTRTLLWILGLVVSANVFAQPPDTMWTRTYGAGNCIEVFPADDGGILVVGVSHADTTSSWFWLMKTTDMGDSLWTISFDELWEYQNCKAAAMCSNGDIIFSGNAFVNVDSSWWTLLYRVTQEGEIVWQQDTLIDSVSWESIEATSDNGVILAGDRYSGGDSDAFLKKIDADGNEEWRRGYRGAQYSESPLEINVLTDGTFLVTGIQREHGGVGSSNSWAMLVNENGDSVWSRAFEGGSQLDYFYAGDETNEGYLLMGTTDGFSGGDPWILKTDANGDSISKRVYESSNQGGFWFDWFIPMGGGYTCVGVTNGNSYPWLVRLDADGNVLWELCCWGYENTWLEQTFRAFQRSDGSYVIGGRVYLDGLDLVVKVWLTRTTADPLASPQTPRAVATEFALHQNFPNPFNPETTISFDIPRATHTTIKVFDLTGREVRTLINETLQAGTHQVHFDGHDLPSGIYFYRLSADGFDHTRKMILLK